MKSIIVIIFSCFVGCTNSGNTDKSAPEPKHKVSSLIDTSHNSAGHSDSISISASTSPDSLIDDKYFYTPDGKPAKVRSTDKTIGQVKRRYDSSGLTRDYDVRGYPDDVAIVTFKLFTTTPVLIYTEHPERIKKYISQFNLKKYFRSASGLEYDLWHCVKEGTLTDMYVINTLGRPDNRTTAVNGDVTIDNYYYNDLDLMITFTNSVATSYVINH